MKGASLYLASPAKLTPLTLRGLIQRHKMQHGGVDLVVVDYLGLMHDDTRSKDRQEEISRISRAIKVMSGEFGIPFLVLSQLNRQAEQGRPLLSHLRESGSIEQDADIVIFLSRDDSSKSKDTEQIVICDVAKQRDGVTRWVPLLFQRNIQRFKDANEPDEPARPSHYETAAVEDDYEDDEAPF
jgi:replicative DNA helicase